MHNISIIILTLIRIEFLKTCKKVGVVWKVEHLSKKYEGVEIGEDR